MIDLHSHILPGVDDGAENNSVALAIAREAVEQGIDGIVATPHYLDESYRLTPEETAACVGELQKILDDNKINLTIYTGAEVLITPDLGRRVAEKMVATLNNSRYLLIEFPTRKFPEYTNEVLYDLKVLGIKPVIAHPERYQDIIADPNILYNWIKEDIYTQLNAGSLLGFFGSKVKETAEQLVKHHLIQLIGSDVHSTNRRPECLAEGITRLRGLIGNKADVIIKNNQRVIKDQDLILEQPVHIREKKGLISMVMKAFNF